MSDHPPTGTAQSDAQPQPPAVLFGRRLRLRVAGAHTRWRALPPLIRRAATVALVIVLALSITVVGGIVQKQRADALLQFAPAAPAVAPVVGGLVATGPVGWVTIGVGAAVVAGGVLAMDYGEDKKFSWEDWFGGAEPPTAKTNGDVADFLAEPGKGPVKRPNPTTGKVTDHINVTTIAPNAGLPNSNLDITLRNTGYTNTGGYVYSYRVYMKVNAMCRNDSGGADKTWNNSLWTSSPVREKGANEAFREALSTFNCGAGYTLEHAKFRALNSDEWSSVPSSGYDRQVTLDNGFDYTNPNSIQGARWTVECVDAAGQIHEISADSDRNGDGLVMPSCKDAGMGTPVGSRINYYTPKGQTGPEVYREQIPRDAFDDYPECDVYAGKTCTTDVYVGGEKCTIGAEACQDWTSTERENPEVVECRWGPYSVGIESCGSLECFYYSQGCPQSPENTDGNPDTTPYVPPGWAGPPTVYPEPDTDAPPATDPETDPDAPMPDPDEPFDPDATPHPDDPRNDPTEDPSPSPSPTWTIDPEWDPDNDPNDPRNDPTEEPTVPAQPEPDPENPEQPEPSTDPTTPTEPEPSTSPSTPTEPEPTTAPSTQPTPDASPSASPSPSSVPTIPVPGPEPTTGTETQPTTAPTVQPTPSPSVSPSVQPSTEPTPDVSPSVAPSPSVSPSVGPSTSPSPSPSPSSTVGVPVPDPENPEGPPSVSSFCIPGLMPACTPPDPPTRDNPECREWDGEKCREDDDDDENCLSDDWKFNPVDFVYEPTVCAILYTLEPEDEALRYLGSKLKNESEVAGIESAVTSFRSEVDEVIPAGSDSCAGPAWPVNLPGWSTTLHPFSACGRMEPAANAARAVSSLVIVLAGGYAVIRNVARGFDYQLHTPEVDSK